MLKTKHTGPKTHYICQMYERLSGTRGKTAALSVAKSVECSNEEQLVDRAERSFASGSFVGVDAYRIEIDPDLGEPNDPVFLARLGDVPELEF
ncbi:hypothetical protein JI58_02440 [Marinosulfonomonas sp. PRT-SC04]|nr:hypothetical protein JI58_02440 [Marinosulfonomonas sp. PRT-SC04]